MGRLANKVAVVTGGAGGMGQVVCKNLAEAGADIAVVDIVDPIQSKSQNYIEAAGRKSIYCQTDITKEAEVEKLYAIAQEELGGVDILINLAGVVGRRDASISDPHAARDFYMSEPYDEWEQVIKTNVWGAELMVRHAFPLMKIRGGGSIVSISSLAGRFGAAAAALSYTASKAALVGVAKQWAKMLGSEGIRSNIIAPGPVRTKMLESMSAESVAAFTKATLTGRISAPEDVAHTVCFLASDESANISGQVIEVNGGCWIPA